MTTAITNLTKLLQYRLSEAVNVTQQQDGRYLVKHKISHKTLIMGGEESRVLQYFIDNLNDVNEPVIPENIQLTSAVIDYLAQRDILLKGEQTFDSAYNVYQQALPILEQSCNLYELKAHDTCFIGLPYSQGNANSSGCDKAPTEIRKWMNSRGLKAKSFITDCQLANYLRVEKTVDFTNLKNSISQKTLNDIGDFYLYPYEDNSKIFARLKSLSKALANKKIAPLYFGGDHSITYPILQGLNNVYNKIYVIHIDAHTDRYHTEIDQLHMNNCVNHHGNFLSKTLNTLDNIEHVYQYGIRGINNVGTSVHHKVTSLRIGELIALLNSGSDIYSPIPAGANVYLSLDVDVLDPAIFPATNSPIPGGLQYHELLTLLAIILKDHKLIGADLVEFNPSKDRQEISHQIFVELMMFIANFMGVNNS